MTIALSHAKCHQLLKANQYSCHDFETVAKFPEEIGEGERREIQFERGLGLTIRECRMRDRVIFKNPPREHPVEFSFHLSGQCRDEYGNYLEGGENTLVGGLEPGGTFDCLKPQHSLGMSIYAELPLLETLIGGSPESNSLELKQFFKTIQTESYCCLNQTTPAMQVTIRQILQCPYQSITKRLYLESKTLELIALTLEPILNNWQQKNLSSRLSPCDRDKIYLAREMLLEQLENPPSLKALAQAVKCNEYKLKQGFRELFGTTVFGCLHDYRMEYARLLLTEETITITDIACAVGYTDISAFCRAFRKKFGISPKTYWQSNLRHS